MTPQELKNSILQLAIQGKLVEQRPEDGTAEELYEQIQEEKQKLRQEKKIKKQKALPEITEDEIPFDIPDSWKWVRGGNIYCLLDGVKTEGIEYPYLEAKYLRGKVEPRINNSGKFACKGTVVVLVDGENSGELFTLQEDGYMGSTFKILYIPESVYKPYVLNFIDFHRQELRNNKRGAAIPHLNKDLFFGLMLPLPPLAEQKRIVAKIEELLPYIEKYEAAWSKLEEFNKKFPDDMQKSILQIAIQGKLVEQRAEEGTAEELYQQIQEEKQMLIKEGKIKKQKALPEITEDEIPFDIPDSWKWVRLGDCGSFVRGSGIKKGEVTPEGMPCVRYGQLYTTYKTRFSQSVSFIPEALFEKCKKARPNDILMALTGENKVDIALAVAYEGNTDLAMGGDMTKFTSPHMSPLYLVYLINSPYGIGCKSKLATGDIIVHISNDKLASIPIPLPPLEEQKRIVAKIEELLPLCNKLK